jgi:hypothetical protein
MSSIKSDFYDIRLPHLSTKELRCQHLDSELIVNGIAAIECGIHTVVDQGSSKKQRKAVDLAFRYFCREFRNQVVPYDRKALSGPDQHRAYLWVDKHEYVWHHHKKIYRSLVLAASTCENTRASYPPGVPGRCYILDWAWFHPYERRRGHFSKAVAYFLARFQRLIADDPGPLETEGLLNGNGLSVRSPEEITLAFDETRTRGEEMMAQS